MRIRLPSLVFFAASIALLVATPAFANGGWPVLVKRQAAPLAFFVISSSLLVEYPFFRFATGCTVWRSLLCLLAANLASAMAGFLALLVLPGGALGGHAVMIVAEGMSSIGPPIATSILTSFLLLALNVAIESTVIFKCFRSPVAADLNRTISWILAANVLSLLLPMVLGAAIRDLGREWVAR